METIEKHYYCDHCGCAVDEMDDKVDICITDCENEWYNRSELCEDCTKRLKDIITVFTSITAKGL